MAEETKPEGTKPAKKPKKALEAPPVEPRPGADRPTPTEIRAAKKAQLVAWSESFGLETEGKVDDLRKRLITHLAKETAAPKEKEPEKRKEELEAKKPAAKKEAPKPAKGRKPARGKPEPKAKAPAKKAEEPEEEPEEEHVPRQKPKLDDRTWRLLRVRAKKAAARPPFHRQEWFRYKKFGDEWRKPQGGQSKLRRHFGYRWNLPSIGYRGPREVRGLHPSGFREVLVHNVRQLDGIDPARQAVRIAHAVGTRKRELIEKACAKREIRVLNRMVTE
ncbi:MAG TPA: 50S ribosomal protein L32e [Thermoplasmata archaeon]|nr:50S ribosomal protein L32e [Thermoplasmata archaeon]